MIIEVKEYYCDICKKKTEYRKIKSLKMPVKVLCSQEDGAPMKVPYVTVKELDVCNDCLEVITVVNYGFRAVEGLRER